jgi:DNA-binding transcriptional regulator YiaG
MEITMTTNKTLEHRLIAKVKKLSVEQIRQVEQFIDSLSQENTEQQLIHTYTKLSEPAFAKVWDNSEDADYDNL